MMLTILMGIHGVRSGHHDDDNIKLPACLPSGSLLLFAIEHGPVEIVDLPSYNMVLSFQFVFCGCLPDRVIQIIQKLVIFWVMVTPALIRREQQRADVFSLTVATKRKQCLGPRNWLDNSLKGSQSGSFATSISGRKMMKHRFLANKNHTVTTVNMRS